MCSYIWRILLQLKSMYFASNKKCCAKYVLFGAISVEKVASLDLLTFFYAKYTRRYVLKIWRKHTSNNLFDVFFSVIWRKSHLQCSLSRCFTSGIVKNRKGGTCLSLSPIHHCFHSCRTSDTQIAM